MRTKTTLCAIAFLCSSVSGLAVADPGPADAQPTPNPQPAPTTPTPTPQPTTPPTPAPQPDPTPAPTPTPEPKPDPSPAPAGPPAGSELAPSFGGASGTAQVGQGKQWNVGIAPRLALTIPTSKLGPMAVGGLEISLALPVMQKRLLAYLDVSATRPPHSGDVMDPRVPGGSASYDIDDGELKVAVGGVFRLFTSERKLIPYGGVGAVMHMIKTFESTSLAPGRNSAQRTYFGFEAIGGADYRLGPGYLLGELRVLGTNLNDLLTGNSNAGNIMVGVGYRLVL